MANFNVSINRAGEGGGLNLNVQVEAPDVLSALDAAKVTLAKTIEASGLAVAVAPPSTPAAAAPPTA